jgi:hypothetical protein
MSSFLYSYNDSIGIGGNSFIGNNGTKIEEAYFDNELQRSDFESENDYRTINPNPEGGKLTWQKIKDGFKKFFGGVKKGAKKVWDNKDQIMDTTKKILDAVKEGSEAIPDGKVKDIIKTVTQYGDKGIDIAEDGIDFIKKHITCESILRRLPKDFIESYANRLVGRSIKQGKYKEYRKNKKRIKKLINDEINSKRKVKNREIKILIKDGGTIPFNYKEVIKKAIDKGKIPIKKSIQGSSAYIDTSRIPVINYQDPIILKTADLGTRALKGTPLSTSDQLSNLKNLR